MWKQSETEGYDPEPSRKSNVPSALKSEVPVSKDRGRAIIGATITIKGDLTGEEDLLIEGKLEGKIECHHHSVTIGKKGRIEGEIHGKIITVEGNVEGDLYGEEQLRVLQSGIVHGNIVAPRVALEDGANFKGNIDMNPKDNSPSITTKDKDKATIPTAVN